MSFDQIAVADATPETGTTFLRHALKVWARELGVTEDHLPGLVQEVLDFAAAAIRDGRYERGVGA